VYSFANTSHSLMLYYTERISSSDSSLVVLYRAGK
jgi:hypothetical protein